MNQATENFTSVGSTHSGIDTQDGNPDKGEELDAFLNKGNDKPADSDPLADNTVKDDDKDHSVSPAQNPFRPDLPFEEMKQNIE